MYANLISYLVHSSEIYFNTFCIIHNFTSQKFLDTILHAPVHNACSVFIIDDSRTDTKVRSTDGI